MELSEEQREPFWRNEIELLASHQGSVSEFCKSRGIREHRLYYWRKKFAKVTGRGKAASPSTFVKMELREPKSERDAGLLDPVWCARFVRELFEGGR